MTSRERTYLGLSIVAFFVPNTLVIAFVARHGFNASAYLGAWVASLPAAQLGADLLLCFLAFGIWSVWEGRRIQMRGWWLVVPATFGVGLCFAMPLFFFFRERALRPGPQSPVPAQPSPARQEDRQRAGTA